MYVVEPRSFCLLIPLSLPTSLADAQCARQIGAHPGRYACHFCRTGCQATASWPASYCETEDCICIPGSFLMRMQDRSSTSSTTYAVVQRTAYTDRVPYREIRRVYVLARRGQHRPTATPTLPLQDAGSGAVLRRRCSIFIASCATSGLGHKRTDSQERVNRRPGDRNKDQPPSDELAPFSSVCSSVFFFLAFSASRRVPITSRFLLFLDFTYPPPLFCVADRLSLCRWDNPSLISNFCLARTTRTPHAVLFALSHASSTSYSRPREVARKNHDAAVSSDDKIRPNPAKQTTRVTP